MFHGSFTVWLLWLLSVIICELGGWESDQQTGIKSVKTCLKYGSHKEVLLLCSQERKVLESAEFIIQGGEPLSRHWDVVNFTADKDPRSVGFCPRANYILSVHCHRSPRRCIEDPGSVPGGNLDKNQASCTRARRSRCSYRALCRCGCSYGCWYVMGGNWDDDLRSHKNDPKVKPSHLRIGAFHLWYPACGRYPGNDLR